MTGLKLRTATKLLAQSLTGITADTNIRTEENQNCLLGQDKTLDENGQVKASNRVFKALRHVVGKG